MRTSKLPLTPLQKVVGFEIAEEIYDGLPIRCQIILDLKMMEWVNQDIADVLGLPYTTVYDDFKRTQIHLAESKLRQILEDRVHYRENHRTVSEL